MRRIANISAFSLLAALLLAGFSLWFVQGEARASGPDQVEACLACHPRSFAGEVHGLGTNNPIFKKAWDAAGSPKECLACHVTGYDAKTETWKADMISCEACHSPIPEDHPNQDMPVEHSNNLCASCHNDSHFGWTDWKASTHYKQNMACTTCHDPHVPNRPVGEDVSVVCQKCHEDVTARAEHSMHAQAGVSCIKCHLGPAKGVSVDPYHQVPDHSFKPVVETCSACHAQQMHDPNPTPLVTPTITPSPVPPTPTVVPVVTPVTKDPPMNSTPFSTMDFTFMGLGLLGLGLIGGLALSPVLDWLMHLFSAKKKQA